MNSESMQVELVEDPISRSCAIVIVQEKQETEGKTAISFGALTDCSFLSVTIDLAPLNNLPNGWMIGRLPEILLCVW